MLFTGDLNCSRELLPHLDLLINDLHWTDVGACAEMWGGVANENTCFFNENSIGTRNDYMIVNPQMIPYIRSFKVLHDPNFRTHRVLQLSIHADYSRHHIISNTVPPSMEGRLRLSFEEQHYAMPEDGAPLSIEELRMTKDYREQWQRFLALFHAAVKSEVAGAEVSYRSYLQKGETNMAWRLWCRVVESSFTSFLKLDVAAASKLAGRGKPHFSSKILGTMHEVIDFDKQTKEYLPINFRSRSLAKKANLF